MKNHLSINGWIGAIALLSYIPSVLALSPVQVTQIASQTTVQITKCERGAGVIIQKNGNTYQVLTIAQLVKTSGCELVTPDGSSYRVDRVQVFPNNIDLAVISFTNLSSMRLASSSNQLPDCV
ncbi:hypothetical protein [Chamaesiphon sp.]|uniref:hypothetical protein n=1 Tax=Chamaesiphon sp. TaxID=2814140 RepID=UPI003594675E